VISVFFKHHKSPLLICFGVAQLTFLLTRSETGAAIRLLVDAVLNSNYALYALLAPLLLAFGIVFNRKLKALNWRWLEWSPFHVKANIALIPINIKWLWLPYALMLAACMPLLAFFEEVIFRYHTTSWVHGLLWGGLAFGALHLVSLVTVRMTIYLSIVGIVFVALYMTAGFVAVFVVHACYNLLALTLLTVERHARLPGAVKKVTASLAGAH
jgi:hypothetical protein